MFSDVAVIYDLAHYYCIVKALCRQEQLDVSFGERERKFHRDPAGNRTWDHWTHSSMAVVCRLGFAPLPWVQCLSDKRIQLVIGRSQVQFPARSLWIFPSLSPKLTYYCIAMSHLYEGKGMVIKTKVHSH